MLVIKLPEIGPKNWTKIEAILTVLKDIANGGQAQLLYMQKHNMLVNLIDFMMGKKSPLCKGENRYPMGNALTNPNFKGAISVVSQILLHSYTPTFKEDTPNKEQNTYYKEGLGLVLSDEDIMMWTNKEFVIKILKDGQECGEFGQAITHYAYNNESYSKKIAKILLKGVNSNDFEKVKNYMEVIRPFLLMKDSL